MAAPSALVLRCDTCGDVPHRVLRGKVSGKDEVVFEGVVKCSKCGRIRSVLTREPRPIQVPLVISFLERSERTTLEFSPDESIELGQEMELGDTRLKITAIEVQGRRLEAALAKEVSTLWAKRTDQVRVKFSVNMGNRTVPHDVIASPDEEFEVGDIVDLGHARAVVHHIRTPQRTVHEGRVRADEIVRMYGRVIRERTSR